MTDWSGMNVILEYGNVQTNACSVRNFAQSWANLSSDHINGTAMPPTPLGSDGYNQALEDITHTVIDGGQGGSSKINGSALLRIRSNERIFYPSTNAASTWPASHWELAQYELNTAHQFVPVPVFNTPNPEANAQDNISPLSYSHDPSSSALIDWVYAHKVGVANGNYKLPASYTDGGNTFTLAPTADVAYQQVHYWDLNWDTATSHYKKTLYGMPDATARKLRHQISLNTCQGCHTGETKTFFTHVIPVGYQSTYSTPVPNTGDYWSTPPQVEDGTADFRFGYNVGTSSASYPGTYISNYKLVDDNNGNLSVHIMIPRVSPFITGRAYDGTSYADDKVCPTSSSLTDDDSDISMQGQYYVYDPSDNGSSTGPLPDGLLSYNELGRRKTDLCNFS